MATKSNVFRDANFHRKEKRIKYLKANLLSKTKILPRLIDFKGPRPPLTTKQRQTLSTNRRNKHVTLASVKILESEQ